MNKENIEGVWGGVEKLRQGAIMALSAAFLVLAPVSIEAALPPQVEKSLPVPGDIDAMKRRRDIRGLEGVRDNIDAIKRATDSIISDMKAALEKMREHRKKLSDFITSTPDMSKRIRDYAEEQLKNMDDAIANAEERLVENERDAQRLKDIYDSVLRALEESRKLRDEQKTK